MILSHQFGFVFMHNPKAGGTSIRDAIEQFGDDRVRFYGVDRKPESPMHNTDRAHIGIDEFSRFYPDQWQRAQDYEFFTLWRASTERLLSSVSEYSRRHSNTDIRFLGPDQRTDFLFETLDGLAAFGAAENILDRLEYTHFRPQWIYAMSSRPGLKITLFPLTEIDRLFAAIEQRTGVSDLTPTRASNRAEHLPLPGPLAGLAANSQLRQLVTRAPGLSHLTPLVRRYMLHHRAHKSPPQTFELGSAEQDRLMEFTKIFYARDLAFLPPRTPALQPRL